MNGTQLSGLTACFFILAALLSGCNAGETDSSAVINPGIADQDRPSISAAQLNNDGSNSLSYAQEVASGAINVTDSANSPAQASLVTVSTVTTGSAQALAAASTNAQPVETQFKSHTSDGFSGELRGNKTVRITWQKDPTARGYNVYRQAKYIATVFGEEYIDEDIFDESYYYEIQAFDHAENYKYIATGLTVKVAGLGRLNPQSPIADGSLLDGYALVFADEFNGSTLDASKWNTSYLWGPELVINSEEQYYVDILKQPDFGFNPFRMNGETVTIQSIRTPSALLAKAKDQPYLSGVMTSYDAFKFTYGYVETRAKVTFGQGYWPAFWLLNAYYVEDKPEIDIMEFIGNDQDVVYHTYHYYDANDKLRSTKSMPTPGIDFTADFHTFGVEWKPGVITYYIDGIERHKISDPKVSQQDMYIIANTALGGWWPGSPNTSTPFPGEFEIDYIRAYQKVGPHDDPPLNDGITHVQNADDVPNTAPNHRPPFELWPQGYPGKQ
jgi:beta-glucanase (GH16 family)